MSIPEDLSAQLPTPRPDEPAALRQDIADELADHLLCAARSEQLKDRSGGPISEPAALAAAIERFGEPAVIARRLWWDAMKERIMAQRILTILATAATVAVLFACFFLWQAMQQMRDLQTAELAAQREAMTAMFAELKSTKQADGAQWQTLKFRLVDQQGKPVQGKVYCSGTDDKPINDTVVTGVDGLASFFFPPGQYSTSIEVAGYVAESSVLLAPRPLERTIVCPSADQPRMMVHFDVKLTEQSSLHGQGGPLYFVAVMRKLSMPVNDVGWTLQGNDAIQRETVSWLLDGRGKVLGELSPNPTHGFEVASYLCKELKRNVALKTPQGLTAGLYNVLVAAYQPAPADGAAETEVVATNQASLSGSHVNDEVPSLALVEPDLELLRRNERSPHYIFVDSSKPEAAVVQITDSTFPPRPKRYPATNNAYSPSP